MYNTCKNYILSKTSYLKGIQCKKYLYLIIFQHEWKDNVSESKDNLFNNGYEKGDIFIVYINKDFIKNGIIKPAQFFKIQFVKEEVIRMQNEIENNINQFKNLLSQNKIPDTYIGSQCITHINAILLDIAWDTFLNTLLLNCKNWEESF